MTMSTTTIPMPVRPAARPTRPVRPVRLVPPAARRAQPSPAVYRRRRAVAALLGGLFVLAGARAADAVVGNPSRPVHDGTKVVHYHVQPGDTLWSIAHRLAPDADPREVVDMLAQAHGSPNIAPGDVIDWAGR